MTLSPVSGERFFLLTLKRKAPTDLNPPSYQREHYRPWVRPALFAA